MEHLGTKTRDIHFFSQKNQKMMCVHSRQARDYAKQLEEMGVQTVIVTYISKDGTLDGPNLEMLSALKNAVDVDITASGGIKDIEDIKNLAKMNLYGAIAGRSIYDGTLDLEEAIRLTKQREE